MKRNQDSLEMWNLKNSFPPQQSCPQSAVVISHKPHPTSRPHHSPAQSALLTYDTKLTKAVTMVGSHQKVPIYKRSRQHLSPKSLRSVDVLATENYLDESQDA